MRCIRHSSGRLYVIGGWYGNGLPAYADAYYAPLLRNGGIGAFTETTSLPVGVVGHSAVVSLDGKAYIANFTNLFLGMISAVGSISSWAKQATIPGMNHNNYGNVGIALLPNRMVVVDTTSTFVCRLDDSGQVLGLETRILNPVTFNQRSAYTIDGKVFVAATSGKLYRIDEIAPNATWDDFSGGPGTWSLTPDWSLKSSSSGAPLLAVNTEGDRFAWKTNITLATSWAVETTVQLSSLYNDGGTTGTAGFALGSANLNLLALADVIYSEDGWAYPGVGYRNGAWNDSLTSHPWIPGATNTLTLRLERQPVAPPFYGSLAVICGVVARCDESGARCTPDGEREDQAENHLLPAHLRPSCGNAVFCANSAGAVCSWSSGVPLSRPASAALPRIKPLLPRLQTPA